jgi:hypothetical protein
VDNGLDSGYNVSVHHVFRVNSLHLLNQTLEIPLAVLPVLNFVYDCHYPSLKGIMAFPVRYRDNLLSVHLPVRFADLCVWGIHAFAGSQ